MVDRKPNVKAEAQRRADRLTRRISGINSLIRVSSGKDRARLESQKNALKRQRDTVRQEFRTGEFSKETQELARRRATTRSSGPPEGSLSAQSTRGGARPSQLPGSVTSPQAQQLNRQADLLQSQGDDAQAQSLRRQAASILKSQAEQQRESSFTSPSATQELGRAPSEIRFQTVRGKTFSRTGAATAGAVVVGASSQFAGKAASTKGVNVNTNVKALTVGERGELRPSGQVNTVDLAVKGANVPQSQLATKTTQSKPVSAPTFQNELFRKQAQVRSVKEPSVKLSSTQQPVTFEQIGRTANEKIRAKKESKALKQAERTFFGLTLQKKLISTLQSGEKFATEAGGEFASQLKGFANLGKLNALGLLDPTFRVVSKKQRIDLATSPETTSAITNLATGAVIGAGGGLLIRGGAKLITKVPTVTKAAGSQLGQKIVTRGGQALTAGFVGSEIVGVSVAEKPGKRAAQVPLELAGFVVGGKAESKIFGSPIVRRTRFGDPVSEIRLESQLQSKKITKAQAEQLREITKIAKRARGKDFPEFTIRDVKVSELPKGTTKKQARALVEEKPTIFGTVAARPNRPPKDIDVQAKDVVSQKRLKRELGSLGDVKVKGGTRVDKKTGDVQEFNLEAFSFIERPRTLPSGVKATTASEQLRRKVAGSVEAFSGNVRRKKDPRDAEELAKLILKGQSKPVASEARVKNIVSLVRRGDVQGARFASKKLGADLKKSRSALLKRDKEIAKFLATSKNVQGDNLLGSRGLKRGDGSQIKSVSSSSGSSIAPLVPSRLSGKGARSILNSVSSIVPFSVVGAGSRLRSGFKSDLSGFAPSRPSPSTTSPFASSRPSPATPPPFAPSRPPPSTTPPFGSDRNSRSKLPLPDFDLKKPDVFKRKKKKKKFTGLKKYKVITPREFLKKFGGG